MHSSYQGMCNFDQPFGRYPNLMQVRNTSEYKRKFLIVEALLGPWISTMLVCPSKKRRGILLFILYSLSFRVDKLQNKMGQTSMVDKLQLLFSEPSQTSIGCKIRCVKARFSLSGSLPKKVLILATYTSCNPYIAVAHLFPFSSAAFAKVLSHISLTYYFPSNAWTKISYPFFHPHQFIFVLKASQ